jgi:CDP-diacylglycerol pyrophosphatase
MTSRKFDALTRALISDTSRRETIKVLFAGVVGGALGFSGIATATAQALGSCAVEDPLVKSSACGAITDTDSLWQLVQKCENGTATCTAMDTSHGKKHPQWILTKEHQAHNYTLIAGQRTTGIECSTISQSNAPDYWAFALQEARQYLPQKLNTLGMAINSQSARHYDQLHIHLSCIESNVQSALTKDDKNIPRNPQKWKTHILALGSPAHQYRVLQLQTLTYNHQNLFMLLQNMVGAAAMPDQTLIVAARPQAMGGGYYILNSANPDPGLQKQGTGLGESLLNENC